METEVAKSTPETEGFVYGRVTDLMRRFEVNGSLISNGLKGGLMCQMARFR